MDIYEVKAMLQDLSGGRDVNDNEVDNLMQNLDENHNGLIERDEFLKWYTASEKRIENEIKEVFSVISKNEDFIHIDTVKL